MKSNWISFFLAAIFCSAAQAASIEMLEIRNPGNAADTRYDAAGKGAVADNYKIGRFEITAGQYVEFLNSVAFDDPNGLYNPLMADTFTNRGANIQRIGLPGSYSYSVAFDWEQRPVNYVNLWDAARFANWLHNGKPVNFQGPGVTEDGAYLNIGSPATFARQAGARFFIPTDNEWYKAAYHNQAAGLAASYFDYPTSTNAIPSNDPTEATNTGNNANFFTNNYSIGVPYYRSVANEYELSVSTYQTHDQGGNVWEWTETSGAGSNRLVRGGSYKDNVAALHASTVTSVAPDTEADYIGFRIAEVPEPASITLCWAGLVAAALWQRRVKRA